jgi:hypothetical protein
MTVNARYVRHRSFDRLRHSKDFVAFLTVQAARLVATGATKAFTVAFATNDAILNSAAHGLADRAGPFALTNAGGALPAGLRADTLYWVKAPTAGTLALYTNPELTGSPAKFTTNGTGTHSLVKASTAEAIFNELREGKSAEQIEAATDIDNL